MVAACTTPQFLCPLVSKSKTLQAHESRIHTMPYYEYRGNGMRAPNTGLEFNSAGFRVEAWDFQTTASAGYDSSVESQYF